MRIEEAVTLDQLSNGRLDLGLGRGVSLAEPAVHAASGEDETQGRFDEAYAMLQQGATPRAAGTGLPGRHWGVTCQALLLDVKEALVDEFVDAERA
jgi:alkanesulfonate monooxygenase SsuD/methylene tetrahydromethanopterin reductase-like flavin-dependent oxidoreductase (luciferase family)